MCHTPASHMRYQVSWRQSFEATHCDFEKSSSRRHLYAARAPSIPNLHSARCRVYPTNLGWMPKFSVDHFSGAPKTTRTKTKLMTSATSEAVARYLSLSKKVNIPGHIPKQNMMHHRGKCKQSRTKSASTWCRLTNKESQARGVERKQLQNNSSHSSCEPNQSNTHTKQ